MTYTGKILETCCADVYKKALAAKDGKYWETYRCGLCQRHR